MKDTFEYSFIDGAKVTVLGQSHNEYKVDFIDQDTDTKVYTSHIKPGHWAKASPEWYINWKIEVSLDGQIIDTHQLELQDKRVMFRFESKCLGDTLAWMPYIEEFQKKHKCNAVVASYHNDLFLFRYNSFAFVHPQELTVFTTSVDVQYKLGLFTDAALAKKDFRKLPLQHVAADHLGLPLKNLQAYVNPITEARPMPDKYVCIAPHSTAQAKYWNNPTGWQDVIDYLNKSGYKVLNISKEANGYMGNAPLKNTLEYGHLNLKELLPVIKHAECFIGISSGLAWLAWALEQRTIIISGFTEPWYEFTQNTTRLHNPDVCNGCFCDPAVTFDKSDWNWCPYQKGTGRQFECSKTITAQQVIGAFENKTTAQFSFPEEQKDLFSYLWKEIWIDKTYYHEHCHIEKDDVVVDLGANIGVFSAWALDQGASKVYAVEPDLINYTHLTKNVPEAISENIGIARETGIMDLFVDGTFGGHSLLPPPLGHPTQSGNTYKVKTKSFVDYLSGQNIEHIDFLKIDTEGAEVEILENLNNLDVTIDKVFLEFHHPLHPDRVFENFLDNLREYFDFVGYDRGPGESIVCASGRKQKDKNESKEVLLMDSKTDVVDSISEKFPKGNTPVIIIGCEGMGDTLSSTPVLRKLYEVYKRPIDVFTQNPVIFKNSPIVNDIIDMTQFPDDHNYADQLMQYQRHLVQTTFTFIHHQIFENVTLKHNLIDIRQFHASFLGFDLLPEEMTCEFYPDSPNKIIHTLPEKYIALHPAKTWDSRSWSKENWQLLADELGALNIPVVLVGKESSEYSSFYQDIIKKPVYNVALEEGVSYLNALNLSDTWHVLNQAAAVITMDSGILHLAGTTDTHIIQLGSSINPKLRAPYRKGTQDYKYSYVPGTCDLFCASNMEYGQRAHNTIHGIPELMYCLENKSTFECHPSVKNVVNEVKKVYI